MADVQGNGIGSMIARIDERLLGVAQDVGEIKDELRNLRGDHDVRIRAVETCTTRLDTNQQKLLEDAKKGDRNNNIFAAIASVLTATVAGVFTYITAGIGK